VEVLFRRADTLPPPILPTAAETTTRLEERLLLALQASNVAAALMLASTIAYLDPTHQAARRIKARCAHQLESAEAPAFPREDAIPRMLLSWDDIREWPLAREAAYVLACVDGASTVATLVDVSALKALVAYEALDWLIGAGIAVVS
jgi:hypothetical protein